MAQIKINTEEVRSTGTQFANKGSELEALVGQANNLMNSLQGQFVGQRATKIFGEWSEMQPSLKAAIESLRSASSLLQRAADDFASTDSVL